MRAAALALGLIACVPALPAAGTEGFGLLKGHGGPVRGLAVSPDGRRALSASFDYSVGLWDLEGRRLLRWLEGHEAAGNAVVFLPDGRRAASAGDDFDIILWDLETGEALRRLEGHEGKLLALRLSPDGRRLASAGWDGRAGLWDIETGELIRWLEGHRSNINDVAFAKGGETVYTASYDGTIRRWDARTGSPERVVVDNGFGVNCIRLNEAAGWLAYGGVDGATRILDLATGEEIADMTLERRPILAMALSPAGDRLAVGDGEGWIMVLDTSDWSVVHDFHAAKKGPIWALAFSADGRRLLAGGLSPDVAVWPLQDDAEAIFTGLQQFQRPLEEMSNGQRQFVRKCSVCHTLTGDGGRKAGPTLAALFGRPAGAVEGYSYSEALRDTDLVWSAETIDALFRLGPDHYTPGSKMPMQRIGRPEDRADLIDFLREATAPR